MVQIPSNSSETLTQTFPDRTLQEKLGVNLGEFYGQTRAVGESPVFAQQSLPKSLSKAGAESLHAALVKIRLPQSLDDATLGGIGLTLSQLNQLGLPSAVVVDCDIHGSEPQFRDHETYAKFVNEQADRVVGGIDAHSDPGARRVDGILSVTTAAHRTPLSSPKDEQIRVISRRSILSPLQRDVIPVLAPIGYDEDLQKFVSITADSVMLALTKELAGLSLRPLTDIDPQDTLQHVRFLQAQVSLDRLIILDPLGGIPSIDIYQDGHVFINMEQEFRDIERELQGDTSPKYVDSRSLSDLPKQLPDISNLHNDNLASHLAITLDNNASVFKQNQVKDSKDPSQNSVHLRNLRLLHKTLSILPPSTSALLTTPQEAATSGRLISAPIPASGVGTRRRRNALIHNLLTDKPPYSSSLPTGRLGASSKSDAAVGDAARPIIPATFLKRGMPLTVIPDPRKHPWQPPGPEQPRITLHDPRIDISRLVDLIEDSFNRKLDVNHYLARVNDRIAGVIIAGEYEGGALLTWETPPDVELGVDKVGQRQLVPYLDKFAVRKRSQGAGGVADIVFTAMVRACFPDGVCWRSRKDNPVNKWYFERARGTWKVPDTNWTMFWTTEDVSTDSQVFADYAGVCRAVEPSWADNKMAID